MKRLLWRGLLVGATAAGVATWFSVETNAATAVKSNPPVIDLQDGGQRKLDRTSEILLYGVPDRGPSLKPYLNHALCFDQSRKVPIWVGEHLRADRLEGSAHRNHSNFQRDPSYPARFQSENSDYARSGYSRGHMSPAGNCKHDQQAMNDTFYLTNIVPQNYENNAGFWNRLEIYARQLAKRFDDVRIFTGPLFLPEQASDGKLYVRYQVLGANQVAVPTHLYKIILAERDGQKAIGCFVVPNQPVGYDRQLVDFQVDIDLLERQAGIDFFPKLAAEKRQLKDLCRVDGCQLMSQKDFEQFFLLRRMSGAHNGSELERAWNEAVKLKLDAAPQVLSAYAEAKRRLESRRQG